MEFLFITQNGEYSVTDFMHNSTHGYLLGLGFALFKIIVMHHRVGVFPPLPLLMLTRAIVWIESKVGKQLLRYVKGRKVTNFSHQGDGRKEPGTAV